MIKISQDGKTASKVRSSDGKEKVSKIDAAERQLKTAIKLFFDEGDLVSIHTLVSAADGILTGLCKKKGIPPGVLRDVELFVVPGREKEWLKALNKAQNFFKHADNDPSEIYELNAKGVHMHMFSAVEAFQRLTKKLFVQAFVFEIWFFANNPKLLKEGEYKDAIVSGVEMGVPVKSLSVFRELLNNPYSIKNLPSYVYIRKR